MSIIPNNTIIVPVNTAATTNEITLSADFCFFIPIIARTIPTKVTAIIDSNNASEDVGLIHSSIRNPQTSPSRNNAKVLNLLFIVPSFKYRFVSLFSLSILSDIAYRFHSFIAQNCSFINHLAM